MTITNDQSKLLKSLGFKMRNKNRYSYLTVYNQFISVNIMDGGFQLEIDGRRVYSKRLSFNDVIRIITILFSNETR